MEKEVGLIMFYNKIVKDIGILDDYILILVLFGFTIKEHKGANYELWQLKLPLSTSMSLAN